MRGNERMEEKPTMRSRGKSETSHQRNWWKWAFLILLGIIIGAIVWVFVQLQPYSEGSVNSTPLDTSDEIVLEVRTGKEELTQLVNQYIENNMDENEMQYTLVLEDEAQLQGEIEVFGFPVPFSLLFDPYVLENGNLQLRATDLQLGTLSLPISFAMNQIGSRLPLPDWIAMDSETQLIVVNLNEFELQEGVHFSMERINLPEDDIRIHIHLPQDAVQ